MDGGLCEIDPPGNHQIEWILNKSYDVGYSSLEVPPNGLVLFEVRLSTVTTMFGGGPNLAVVNSSVVCPFVQFQAREAIHTGPPI
jgi:hypothetical protein